MTPGFPQHEFLHLRECWLLLLSTHADSQRVDISFTVFVCFLFAYLFVRLWITLPGIKLVASNFARRFIGVQGRESPIFVNFAPQKPKISRRIGQRAQTEAPADPG